jgi:leader peptidase (prepilin peptidase)/N-methyltransferase
VDAALVAACALAGVPVAGFLNVLIDRVPERLPLRAEQQEGEACAPVRVGLPLQPYLLRRGRCADGEALPRRYLWVELATAALFALTWWRWGDTVVVYPVLVFAAALVATSTIDLQVHRIPDRIVFPALGLSILLIVAVVVHLDAGETFKGALIGMVTYFLILFPFNLINPRWMGFGDVKLALLLGLFLGWFGWGRRVGVAWVGSVQFVFYGTIIGMLAGVIGGLVLTGFKMRRHFPLGPFIAAGALFVVLFASWFQA